MARPRSDPGKVAIGLELLEQGDAEAAVERSGLSLATLYRARSRPASPSPAPRPGSSARRRGVLRISRPPSSSARAAREERQEAPAAPVTFCEWAEERVEVGEQASFYDAALEAMLDPSSPPLTILDVARACSDAAELLEVALGAAELSESDDAAEDEREEARRLLLGALALLDALPVRAAG